MGSKGKEFRNKHPEVSRNERGTNHQLILRWPTTIVEQEGGRKGKYKIGSSFGYCRRESRWKLKRFKNKRGGRKRKGIEG